MALHAGRKPMASETEPEATPMEPLYQVAELVEQARVVLLEAAKVADENELPGLHMELTDTRDRVMRCQSEVVSWTGGRS